jgi:hypothetical protein
MRAYFMDRELGLGVPSAQILDLFDSPLEPGRQRNSIRLFLESLVTASAGSEIRNIFVHYVGHGMIIDKAYYVALSTTTTEEETTTCLRMRDLGITLHNYHGFRRFVILDCCYAAATAAEWMGGESAITQKASQAFQGDDPPDDEQQLSVDEITQGTTLLCAADQFEEAMSPANIEHTMFGDALLNVLKYGAKNAGPFLNVNNLEGLTWTWMKHKYPEKAVRPVVHSPDQPQGNIARIGIFPNHKYKMREKSASNASPKSSSPSFDKVKPNEQTPEKLSRPIRKMVGILIGFRILFFSLCRRATPKSDRIWVWIAVFTILPALAFYTHNSNPSWYKNLFLPNELEVISGEDRSVSPSTPESPTATTSPNTAASPPHLTTDSNSILRFPKLKNGTSVTLVGCIEHNAADSHIISDRWRGDVVWITKRGPKVKNWTKFWNACPTGEKCQITGVVKFNKDTEDWEFSGIDKFEHVGTCMD